MAPIILSVRDVTKSFGNLRALDRVSIDLEEQKISILIGPNGSGKTTLINVVSGLYKPDSGKVRFLRKDVTGLPPYKLYGMGLARTFQIPALFWKLTVLENLLVAEKRNLGESFSRSFLIVGLQSWQDFLWPWRDTSSGLQMIRGLVGVRQLIRNKKIVERLFRERAMISFARSLFD